MRRKEREREREREISGIFAAGYSTEREK